jgi:hypothetical protein
VATSYDALIAGAGSAGVGAAVTAARLGMKTLLVESENGPGGAIAAGFHAVLCGLYGDVPVGALNGGICQEVADRLGDLSPEISRVRAVGRVRVLPFDAGDLSRVIADLFAPEPRLTVRYGTSVNAVCRSGATMTAVGLSTGERVKAGVFLDCTGDAALARLAEAPVMEVPPAERQLGGFGIRFEGLAGDLAMLPVAVPYCLAQATEAGRLPHAARFTTFIPGNVPGEGVCKLAVPVEYFGKPGALTRYAESVCAVLRQKTPALSDARIVGMSARVIPRDGARLRGRAILTEEDILSARTVKGAAVRGAWPIEFWHPVRGPEYAYLPPASHYDIPSACLRSETVANLLCAGRCISATARAAASLRVAGTCLALGELAALVAARELHHEKA